VAEALEELIAEPGPPWTSSPVRRRQLRRDLLLQQRADRCGALLAARTAGTDRLGADPVAFATAMLFVALGAG
jgi:hypothetical protein